MVIPPDVSMIPGRTGSRLPFPVRRHLLIAAVFLLAGAVVNVAVAWGCALWSPPGTIESPSRSEDFSRLVAPIPTDEPGDLWVTGPPVHVPGQIKFPLLGYSGVGVRSEIAHAWTSKDRDSYRESIRDALGEFYPRRFGRRLRFVTPSNINVLSVNRVSAGLPMYSLQGIHAESKILLWRQGALPLPPRWMRGRAGFLPLYPIWPGFAVNTVLYATVLWLLIPGPFVLRRFIRVKRGLCPACAYPRGESDVCSECGKAISSRRVTAT